ncbi:unnamed protein product [Cunninghamella echinulata]
MIIDSLVNRIVSQLPDKGRKNFGTIEYDQTINELVTTLIDLSKYRISNIISLIIEHIEEIDRFSTVKYHKGGYIPTYTLQTHSFLLHLLAVCIQEHWLHCNQGIHGKAREQILIHHL